MSTNSSTDTEYRFPTLPAPPGSHSGGIPILPRSSIFQTVMEDLHMPDIEDVMARPAWSFEEASLRLFKEKKAREAEAARPKTGREVIDAAEAAAKKVTPKKAKATPKRRPR